MSIFHKKKVPCRGAWARRVESVVRGGKIVEDAAFFYEVYEVFEAG